jgi:hypothetical protein
MRERSGESDDGKRVSNVSHFLLNHLMFHMNINNLYLDHSTQELYGLKLGTYISTILYHIYPKLTAIVENKSSQFF